MSLPSLDDRNREVVVSLNTHIDAIREGQSLDTELFGLESKFHFREGQAPADGRFQQRDWHRETSLDLKMCLTVGSDNEAWMTV